MDINDVNPWETLGLEEPETEASAEDPAGGQEQEVAEPAGEGEQDRELAETGTDDDMDEDQGEPEEEPEKKPLTKEERAANARRRRQQEIDNAVSKAVEKALAEERQKQKAKEEEFFKAAKIKNVHKGNAEIESLDDGLAWATADRLARANERLRKGQLTAEDLQALVEQTPVVKAVQEQQARQEQAAQADNRNRFEQDVQMEIAQIQKLDPTVKNLADIIKMDTGKEFARLVQKGGLSYLEAFRLANMDRLMEQRASVAAAAAKTAAGGKEHLTKTRGVGNPVADVPQDVKDRYRIFDQKATDAEIERHYRKDKK
jgi:hypothetical protein